MNVLKTGIVIAYFSKDSFLEQDFIDAINLISIEYKTLIVYVGDIKNNQELNCSSLFLKYGDQGYDLNCYIEGAKWFSLNFHVSNLIFFNNSFRILNKQKFCQTIKVIETNLNKSDFVFFSKSYEVTPHYQSFFFGFSISRLTHFQKCVFHKIISENLPFTRKQVIEKFELRSIFFVDFYSFSHDFIFKPTKFNFFRAYFFYLITLGFLDYFPALLQPWKLNPSTFLKNSIESKFGFRKIKSSSIINKLKNANKSTKISFR
jgi:hypothetical protein